MLFQLCYASKITATDAQVLIDLRDILNEARHFNTQHNIYGVLYFGEGYFIQCLEGKQALIMALYDKICADLRHQQTKLLIKQSVEHARFEQWAMKYVTRHSQIQAYFHQLGHAHFEPFKLEDQDIPALIEILSDLKQVPVV